MVGKRLVNTGGAVAAAGLDPLQNFETVTYTGNGGTQKITGYIRKGAAFNGSSSGITLPKSILDDGALKTFSISLWFQTSSTSEQMLVSTSASSSNAGINLNLQSNGYLIFQMSDGSGNSGYMQHQTDMSDGDWHHVVVTYSSAGGSNDATTSFYLDGTDITSSVASGNSWSQGSGSTFSSISYLALGRWPASSYYYLNGKLDQVRFFNTELNSTQVGQLADEEYGDAENSVTDFFGNGTGIALYQLDEDADDTGGVSGKFDGSSAHFNGTDSSVGNTSIDTATTKAVSIWVNAADFSERWPFQQGDGQGVENFIRFYNTDDIQVRWGNVTQTFSGYSADTWYHIVAQTDASGNANVWINGTEVGTSTAPSTLTVDSTNIGRRKNGATWQYYFKGRIDDVRIYSDTLTDAEIGYLYNNTTASIPTDNLTAYYKLDGDATDETTNHDGAATNVTYAYNGTATNVNYLGMAFQPDLVWTKTRSQPFNHSIYDSVRGVNKLLQSNTTIAEFPATNALNSFDSNGFTLGANDNSNTNGESSVAWCWRAAGAANTYNVLEGGTVTSDSTASGAGITAGTITTGWEVSANRDAGFSIVKYTKSGTSGTMGHGLSSAPELIMEKRTDSAAYWNVRVNGITANNQTIYLNESTGVSTHPSLNLWTTPTASVFGYDSANATAGDYIAYCFHSVDGYQKVGSYTGTGVSGNSETTGFRPRFLMVKAAIRPSGGGSWYIFDSVRTTSNPQGQYLQANEPLQEFDGTSVFNIDFENNGFTVNGTNNEVNQSGSTYIYLAIA